MISNNTMTSLLLAAAEDASRWNDVLIHLAAACGAKEAIITARANETARVCISEKMENDFHTPFLGQLDPNVVEDYVTNFRDRDIWADQQSTERPYFPTVMSRKVTRRALERSAFWTWLEPQGIDDTVVVQIGNGKSAWTALNLFFKNTGPKCERRVLDTVNRDLGDIRRAWRLTIMQAQFGSAEDALRETVEESDQSLFLIDPNGTVAGASKAAKAHLDQDLARISRPDGKLSVSKGSVALDQEALADVITSHDAPRAQIKYSLRRYETKERAIQTGEGIGHMVLELAPIVAPDTLPWQHPGLSIRQKFVLRYLAQGGLLKDLAKELGVTPKRVGQIKQQAWQVIGRSYSIPDLRALHQFQNQHSDPSDQPKTR